MNLAIQSWLLKKMFFFFSPKRLAPFCLGYLIALVQRANDNYKTHNQIEGAMHY